MYKIFADKTLIYDSTIEDYKIVKGSISLETNKSGSFTFSIYPDHFFYDRFIKLKTVITVYKSNKIVFRGRILNDTTDHWNNKVITCEGELGFLQDSIIRPFSFSGTPEELFIKFITEHNSQVDEFKRFKIGTVTVVDANDYIARSNTAYESALSNLNSRLIEDSLGGYFYITHDENGTDPIPTINYLADFTKVSSQRIEFGSNLKNYTKTVKADEIATAIIPLGHEVDDGDENTENKKLTIESVNDGKDYVFDESGVSLYGWIFKVVSWDDVTEAANLKTKAEEYLKSVINQNITIELNAIDLHLIDSSIESFNVGDYIRVISEPHNFDSTLLCNKQTIDLLKPENDTVTLGYTYSTFTETSSKASSSVTTTITNISNRLTVLNKTVTNVEQDKDNELGTVSKDLEAIAGAVTDNARNISNNAKTISNQAVKIKTLEKTVESFDPSISDSMTEITIPTFENIDNSEFKDLFYKCAQTWINACTNGEVVYHSLSTSNTDNMKTSVNPMLYATRNDNYEFTETERNIYQEVLRGSQAQTNCITLCNMLAMGIPYEHSRLCGHNNLIGKSGYGFDICKLHNAELITTSKGSRKWRYNPNNTLNIDTFQDILTQAAVFGAKKRDSSNNGTYGRFGLVKTVKSASNKNDGDIWYDEIKTGDILWNDGHSVFCLDVTETDDKIIITYVHATGTDPDIVIKTHTVNKSGESGLSKPITKVARPYYSYINEMLTKDYVDNSFDNLYSDTAHFHTFYAGTTIPANANLKDYLTVGDYRVTHTNAPSIGDWEGNYRPDNNYSTVTKGVELSKRFSYGFKLTVENVAGNQKTFDPYSHSTFLQIVKSRIAEIYFRRITAEADGTIVYGKWKKITYQEV